MPSSTADWTDLPSNKVAEDALDLDIDHVLSMLVVEPVHNRPDTLITLPEITINLLITKCRDILLSQPVFPEIEPPIVICGDTHGQFYDLLRIFRAAGYPNGRSTRYLFLGDYVDRGKQSIETMCTMMAYKIKYPNDFFILRGNHESEQINRVYGFYDECKRRYSVKLFKRFSDLFNCLPPSALVGEKILCMHGGLSPELTSLDQLRVIKRPANIDLAGLLTDLVWSDPSPDTEGWSPSPRGISFEFGRDVVARKCEQLNIDLIARAHMVVEDGYEFYAGRKLVTIFSAPNYCGYFDNAAGIMTVDETMLCSFKVLKPRGIPKPAEI